MNKPGSASTLVIIQSSARGGGFTLPSLSTVGLRNIDADLAYCGSAMHPDDNPYSPLMVYDWGTEEPADIGTLLKEKLPAPLWNYLLNPDNSRGLAASPKNQQLWLLGLIQWHYKKLALDNIRRLSLQQRYSWFVFLRSDYLFTSPLPPLAHREPRALVLQGDNYGGINDRLLVFPSGQFDRVTELFDLSQFADTDLIEALSGFMNQARPHNPERLLHFQMSRIGLAADTDALPQLGFCVRPRDESSRWSMGIYSPTRGVFIKYPTELSSAKITRSPWVAKERPYGSPRARPLTTPAPRYVDWVNTAGYHRVTRLAPLLFLLGEGRIALSIWEGAIKKKLRKTYRKWRAKKSGE